MAIRPHWPKEMVISGENTTRRNITDNLWCARRHRHSAPARLSADCRERSPPSEQNPWKEDWEKQQQHVAWAIARECYSYLLASTAALVNGCGSVAPSWYRSIDSQACVRLTSIIPHEA